MLELLRSHPLPIAAHLKHVFALTYAAPAEKLAPLLPPSLTLDTYNGFGFVAVALVQTESMRPVHFPRRLGMNFILAGYRIFTRFRSREGRSFRGLYILRSSTNRRFMQWTGNLFTAYHFKRCAIAWNQSQHTHAISVVSPGGDADLSLTADLSPADPLPPGLVFPDARTARRFAGPLRYTFSCDAAPGIVRVVEGLRENWSPCPFTACVARNTYALPSGLGLDTLPLACAFHTENISYRWSRGVLYHAEVPGDAESNASFLSTETTHECLATD